MTIPQVQYFLPVKYEMFALSAILFTRKSEGPLRYEHDSTALFLNGHRLSPPSV